jgi:hypothetical protein
MSKPTTEVTARIADIAAKIRGACIQIGPHVDELGSLADTASAVREELQTSRLSIMASVADMSSAGAWTTGEIAKACARAAETGNASPGDKSAKSIATFISEMKNVASPKVRDRFAVILKVCESVWQDEEDARDSAPKDERKSVPMPVHKWRTRKYHLVSQVARDVNADKFTDITNDGLIAYAIANDPDHNAEAIERRLKSMRDQIQGMYDDFGYDEFQTVMEYLADATAAKLKASRDEMLARNQPAAPPSVVATPVVIPSPKGEVEPMVGAVDFLDDVLNDTDTSDEYEDDGENGSKYEPKAELLAA